MRSVVQRCEGASVTVDGQVVGEFTGRGLVVLVGITHEDTEETAEKLARKVWGLRIFEDPAGGPELSASDLAAPILVISQFTLYGETRKGRRPTWDRAAPGHVAEPLVDSFVKSLRAIGAGVQTGRFGAQMSVKMANDGPMTMFLEI